MTAPDVSLSRREARRRALRLLFEADLRGRSVTDALADHRDAADRPDDPDVATLDSFALGLISGVAEHRDAIDGIIADHARDWSVARMPVVDRNVLRLGVYELVFADHAPAAVVIDEAVELVKSLSTDESPRYVNGVLSAVAAAHDPGD